MIAIYRAPCHHINGCISKKYKNYSLFFMFCWAFYVKMVIYRLWHNNKVNMVDVVEESDTNSNFTFLTVKK